MTKHPTFHLVAPNVRASMLKVLFCLTLSIAALFCFAQVAEAADEAALVLASDRAESALLTQQLESGGFPGRLELRDTAAAIEALRSAGATSLAIDRAITFLEALEPEDVDSLSRAIAASSNDSFVELLTNEQRPDGGFGLTKIYETSAFDTALASRALVIGGATIERGRAFTRLIQLLEDNGSWENDVVTTAYALIAIDALREADLSSTAADAALLGGADFLASRQSPDGSWGTDELAVRSTALAVCGLTPIVGRFAELSRGADWLLNAQDEDGDWGDVYSTALAVRALQCARHANSQAANASMADPSIRAQDVSLAPNSVEAGGQIQVTAVVSNSGGSATDQVVANVFTENPATASAPVATVDVPVLEPAQQLPIGASIPAPSGPGRARVYIVLSAPAQFDRDVGNNSAFVNLAVFAAKKTFAPERDWPRTGGDIQRSGTTPNSIHAKVGTQPIWRVPASGGPIAAQGKVMFGNSTRVQAVDAETGAHVWFGGHSFADPNYYRAPIYGGGYVYTGGVGGQTVVNASNGSYAAGLGFWGGNPDWGLWVEHIPNDGGDDIYMGVFAQGFTQCYVIPTRGMTSGPGRANALGVLWPAADHQINSPCDPQVYSFASDGQRAYATYGNGFVLGFDFKTLTGPNGEPDTFLFDKRAPGIVRPGSGPMIDSLGDVIVSGWDGAISESGERIESGAGRVSALNPRTGNPVWTFQTDEKLDGTPVGSGSTIYTVDRGGVVYALNVADGALKWRWAPDDYVPPSRSEMGSSGQSLLISNGRMFVPHPDGRIYTLDLRSGQAVSSTQFDARPYGLAVDDTNDTLYVQTLDGFVGAYPTQQLPEQCAPDPDYVPTVDRSVEPVSVNTDGSQLPGVAVPGSRSISADGSRAAFSMQQLNGRERLFVRDLEARTTIEVPQTEVVSGNSYFSPAQPVLSANGRYLVYDVTFINQFTGRGERTLFLRDLESGTVRPILKNPDGSPRAIETSGFMGYRDGRVAIAGDGEKVAFTSATAGLVAGDTNGMTDVFLVTMSDDTIERVSVSSTGSQLPMGAYWPTFSVDGSTVAFVSESDAASLGRPINAPNVFIRNLDSGAVSAASLDSNGQYSRGYRPKVSGNGRYVVFESDWPTLVPAGMPHRDGLNVATDMYVYDSVSGQLKIASLNDAGQRDVFIEARNGTVSSDGNFVAFSTEQSLAKGDASFLLGMTDVVLRDQSLGRVTLASRNKWGVSNAGGSVDPAMSDDAERLIFNSTVGEFDEGDVDGKNDVFVFTKANLPTSDGETIGALDPACGEPDGPAGADFSDLSIVPGDIEVSELEEGQRGTVSATIRNLGDAESDASSVRLTDGAPVGETLLGEAELSPIEAGGARQVTFVWDPISQSGEHQLTIEVDPARSVFESNLENNLTDRAVVVGESTMTIEASTAEAAYDSNESVEISSIVATSSVFTRDATLIQSIVDGEDEVVMQFPTADLSVTASSPSQRSVAWNTGDTSPGNFEVISELRNSAGQIITTERTAFEIRASVDAGITVESDAASYAAGQAPTITALIDNSSLNADLSGTSVELRVSGPDGTTVFQEQEPLGTIPQAGVVALARTLESSELAAGAYEIEAVLRSTDGELLGRSESDFSVVSSASTADGVNGTLSSAATEPYRMSEEQFNFNVSNAGNADVPSAELFLRFVDIESGVVVRELSVTRDLLRSTPTTGQFDAILDFPEERTYQAGLYVRSSNGAERPLDRVVFRLREAPLKVSATINPAAAKRVLVWACNPADEAAARGALGDAFVQVVPDFRSSQYQGQLGCMFFKQDEEREFLRQMRSGNFNQFWILGRHDPLGGGAADELAARVVAGDGLLVAGGNPLLDLFFNCTNLSPLGSRFAGQLPQGNYAINFASSSAFAGLDGQISGAPIRVTTSSSTSFATARYSTFFGTSTGIVGTSSQFAAGKTVYLGVAPSAFRQQTGAEAFLERAGEQVASTSATVREGGMVRFEVGVEGIPPNAQVETRTTVPAGVTVPQPQSGVSLSGGVLTVDFSNLTVPAHTRSVWLRLPTSSSSITTSTSVFYREQATGQMQSSGQPSIAQISVTERKSDAHAAALTKVNSLTGIGFFDTLSYLKLKHDVSEAGQTSSNPTAILSRLRALVDGVGVLERKSWNGAQAARLAVAKLVTYLEGDYYLATSEG